MVCQRFVRTTPGDTALTRIGANSTARARVSASIVPQTLAAITHPFCERWPAIPVVSDRTLLADMWASVLDCGECSPIAQLKGASGLLEIRRSKVAQMQGIAGGEYQMIEAAKFRKEGCNGSFVLGDRDAFNLLSILKVFTVKNSTLTLDARSGDQRIAPRQLEPGSNP
jgi:hypothetical protein